MAARSLSPKQIQERLQRHRVAVRVRAMQIAKTAVKDQLRAQGLKIWHFSAKEITQLAEDYFANHREELITKATEDINTWPGFARWRLPPGQEVFVKSQQIEHSPEANCAITGQIANG